MSLYTTKYLDILRNYALPETNQTFDELIDATYQDFWNFDFPWYAPDGAGKADFEKLYLLHYLMYEIGQETIELHRAMLAGRLREIMPYYSGIYESLNLDMPWIGNVNMKYTDSEDEVKEDTTEGTENTTENENNNVSRKSEISNTVSGSSQKTGNDSKNSEINGNSSNTVTTNASTDTQSIDSDNPQVNFSGTDYASSMSRGNTNQDSTTTGSDTTTNTETTTNTNNENTTTETTSNNKEDTTDATEKNRTNATTINETKNMNRNKKGERIEEGYRDITRGKIVEEIRKSIYNINLEIINECSDLFMLIY